MRFGVIGAGVIGKLRAQSVRSNPATTLVAVADTNGAAASAAAGGARAVLDYREIIADPGVDAVMVCSPLPLHEAMCVEAFAAGKHVLCEKPLAGSVEACRRILDAARSAGKTLAVGFNHRFYPSFNYVKQVLAGGRIGQVDHVRVFGGHDGLHNFRADWQYKGPLSGGGAMMDVGIHMTDLARWIGGEIAEVYGSSANRVWHVEGSEDIAIAVMKTRDGIPIQYQATWDEWKGYQSAIEVYGTGGMVRGAYAPMYNLLITHDKPGAPRRREVKRYPEIMVREKLKGWQTTSYLSFVEELAGFLEMVAGRPSQLADGLSGLRAVEIAHGVYRSSATGEVVRF